jgi:hypothetical protein
MLEKLSAFSIVTFFLSLVLGIICFYYIIKTLVNQRVMIKVMEENLGEAARDKSVIAMVTLILGMLGISFFAVSAAIYIYAFGGG